jgi:GDP-mannose 6-dehydrogenase
MQISVFGLGYVGCVTAACLAHEGHHVIGVDIDSAKMKALNAGRSPVIETGLDDLIEVAIRRGTLSTTSDVFDAVDQSDVCLICVGTPSRPHGGIDVSYVERVCEQIGQALATIDAYKVIAIRSTLLPGMVDSQLIPLLTRESGKHPDEDFGVVVNPEFLREGSALDDFRNPPFTLIGVSSDRAGDVLARLYTPINAPLIQTDLAVASMVKYASNAFHALKVVFANEIGRLAKKMDLDAMEVMQIFCRDEQLNISAQYLRPGFAFGGSCLPKDLRALLHLARHRDVDLPVLGSVLFSNEIQIQSALWEVLNQEKKKIAIIGLSFKPQTDDLRESPMVQLTEALIGKGLEVRIFDEQINLSMLVGSNRAYIEETIPHLASLTCSSLAEAATPAEVIVASHGLTDDLARLLRPDQYLIDLTRMSPEIKPEFAIL